MGMIDRYKKSGGFIQLLALIESKGPHKREKMLEAVRMEDPKWAMVLEKKMLSMERILSWDIQSLGEVIVRMQDLTLGVAFHGFTEEQRVMALETIGPSQRRRIQEIFDLKNPTKDEISTAFMKIIEQVRQLSEEGQIQLSRIDPDLVVEKEIEEKLASGLVDQMVTSMEVDEMSKEYGQDSASESHSHGHSDSSSGSGNNNSNQSHNDHHACSDQMEEKINQKEKTNFRSEEDFLKLKRIIYALKKDNEALNNKLKTYQIKFEKIKKFILE